MIKKLGVFFCLLVMSQAILAADNSSKSAFLDLSKLPKKVIVIKPDIQVKEVSAGGVPEKIDTWSNQAVEHLNTSLNKQLEAKHFFERVDLPALTEEELANLNEHIALYDVVGASAFTFSRGTFPAWQHKKDHFDYTLGEGLKQIAEKTGADAALVTIGEDYVSSGGRKAARIFAALMGIAIPGSPTFLSTGLIDLHTGNILWMNYEWAIDTKDLRKAEDVDIMMNKILEHYPANKS